MKYMEYEGITAEFGETVQVNHITWGAQWCP